MHESMESFNCYACHIDTFHQDKHSTVGSHSHHFQTVMVLICLSELKQNDRARLGFRQL